MKESEVLLYTPSESPRIRYVARIVFEVFSVIPYRITFDPQEYLHFTGPKINYSAAPLAPSGQEVFIPAAGLLAETGISTYWPELAAGLDWPAFFPVLRQEGAFSFDLFSMVFYWLVRYEEYLPFEADRFGRFPAAQCVANRHGALEYPFVDYWLDQLHLILESRWPGYAAPVKTYRFLPTFDIDIAWAYLHRPFWRHVLATARDAAKGAFTSLAARWRVWSGAQDPYDVYIQLDTLHERMGLKPLFFFLLGNYSKFDPSISHRSDALRSLILKYADRAGLHPSIASNRIAGRLEMEKSRLEVLTGASVANTRQHYLILRFPETYRRLEQVGLRCDFSMGFADAPGFRAGTGAAYPWYDLEQERQSALWIQPFHVMDVTLRDYLYLSPEQALETIRPLIERCREVGTTFCSLWHNSSFYEAQGWRGWPEVYQKLILEASGAPPPGPEKK